MHVLFLTFDSIDRGVGHTQVRGLAQELAGRGIRVTVISFEKDWKHHDLKRSGTSNPTWIRLRFGRFGAFGGIFRVLRLALRSRFIRKVDVIHCRGDLSFVAAAGRRVPRIWDMRAFWPQQRVVTGVLTEESIAWRLMLRIQRYCFRRAHGMNTLTNEARINLEALYGPSRAVSAVIPTSVDTHRFRECEVPKSSPMRVLFLGSGNSFYDFLLMRNLIDDLRKRVPVQAILVSEDPPQKQADFFDVVTTVQPMDIPDFIASCHLGLAVCKENSGISLSGVVPTKLGEYLAAGIPVIVNSSLPMPDHQASKVPWFFRISETAVRDGSASTGIIQLVDSEGLRDECRKAAERYYSLDGAVEQWVNLYSQLHHGFGRGRA